LIERVRSERDRRSVLISLTARGNELVAARRARYQGLWSAALGEFSGEELRSAAAVLDRMRAPSSMSWGTTKSLADPLGARGW